MPRADDGDTPSAALHGFHQQSRGGEKGQVAIQVFGNDRLVSTHVVEDVEHSFDHAVDGEEGVGQGDAPDHRAGYVAFEPLVSGQGTEHMNVAPEYHL